MMVDIPLLLLTQYGYPLVFILAFFEGPIVTIVSSFLAAQGYFTIVILYLLIVAADLTSDSFWYAVGYYGRIKVVERWGHYIGVTAPQIIALENFFERYSGRTLLTAKLTHVVGMPFLLAAGIAKMPYRPFLWFNALATFPKTLVFVIIGYLFGQAHSIIGKYLAYSTWFGLLGLGGALLVYVIIQLAIRNYLTKKI
ncbi:MAG: VTT domain-containing protein [Candidatus Andersenbacteria bacterium]|nr:VTT domain-containing protein [bacterium]MDZ4225442.1 VTT domain-containing protein [Candidatus Andersenbacteria bacterium]